MNDARSASALHRTANFRDVGEALSLWLQPSPLAGGMVFRGGSFDSLAKLEDLGSPRTVLNLRRGADEKHLGVVVHHVPAPDDQENYVTQNRRVSQWVERALAALAAPSTEWPVYIHCTSGRDRTGVIVAALLHVLDVEAETIVEEYALSEGAKRPLIRQALDGLCQVRVGAREREHLRRVLLAR